MNSLTRIMSYDKIKVNQENCNCEECVSNETVKSENQIVEYPKLSEEEIERIIDERYSDKNEKTKIFIRKALKIHGDRYDYSEVEYVDYATEVIIICRNHDIPYKFKQTPNNHLNGNGCRKCQYEKISKSLKSDTEKFIEDSNKVHGVGRYDYSEVDYKDSKTDVWIICHEHDKPYRFPQAPNEHLQGRGCRICANKKVSELNKLTLEEFIEKANEVHGVGTYDYSKVNYIDMKTEVIIICPKHGEFPQTPDHHVYGKNGCSKCISNKGENAIRKFLTEREIEFEEQKKFEGCVYKRQLKFDFYLPKYNLCIESDGNVHFENINWNGKMTNAEMEENLKLNQLRDKIKNDYCKNNGINLLRVNNIKATEELTEYFQNL